MNALMFEARALSGLDDLEALFPTAPDLAFDDPLYAYGLDKARDCNRLPARVLNDAFAEKVLGEPNLDDLGPPTTFQKTTPVKEDEDEIPEISPALAAEIEKISGYNARAAWGLVRHSLTKAVSQPLAKRAYSEPDFGKLLSTERRGKAIVKIYEHGETWEIVED